MEFIFRFLAFCAVVSFTNMIGLHPTIGNSKEWLKTANKLQIVSACIYAGIVIIGYLHIIGWIMYLFFFYGG